MTQYTTFSKKNNDQLKEPMFFGNPVNVARYDQQKYSIFEKLIEKQLSFFWRPEEVDVSKDRIDYAALPENEKHIFISNLKYQILLDSVQGRSPNTVLLPIVSLPELETWIETWSFYECLAEGTEVLTPTGWKDLEHITTDDDCLVYDLNTENVFFEKPKRVVEYDVDIDMVHYHSTLPGQFDQLVTPNHRMPIIHRDIKKDGTQTRYFKEAQNQDYKTNHLAPISGKFINTETNKPLTPFERLCIATQADGTLYPEKFNGKRCGTVPIFFSLAKERKINRLKDIVADCKLELIELTSDKRNNNRKFKVNIPVDLVSKYGDIKTFDWVNLSEFSYGKALEFLEELSHWDSMINNENTFIYSSIHKYNIDVVQSIATLCNKTARVYLRPDSRENHSDVYTVSIMSRNYKDGQSIKREYVPYKGKVRCLETSTGAFLIRYNGVVSVTGNTIHSRSYTHIIRNIVNEPGIIFDDIMVNENIMKRAESVSKYYDELYDLIQKNAVLKVDADKKELKRKLYLCIMSINVLEAIRFYVSFACSFAFAERRLMEGNAKIIKFIARDEALHMSSTQTILNILKSGEDDIDFKVIAEECKEESIAIFREAAEQEKEWADYLFKDGSMIGLNKQILIEYIEYITNIRMEAIGLPAIFDERKSNPIPWINTWLSSDNVQVAPQETEISSYLVGQIDSNLSNSDFDGFEL